jgi:hypothetical protein
VTLSHRLADFGKGALISAMLMALGACATGATSANMVATSGAPPPIATSEPGYHRLRVGNVQGGSETNPLWESNVSNEDFRSALETSLKSESYLADTPEKAMLEVSASLVDLQRPLAGLDLTVTSKVRYTVSPVGGGTPVFDETIAASGTGHMSDALIAVERLRLANEASIRANITAFLQRLHDTLKANP